MFPPSTLTPPTLENFQCEYNELVFGAGTAWGILLIEGLDLAEIRSGDVNLPRDHGQLLGLDLYGGRDIIFDLWVKTDGISLQHAQLALAAATNVRPDEELPLWFQLPNMPLLCIMCRPRKRPWKVDVDYAAGKIGKPELALHATDPRIYTASEITELAPNHPTTTVVLDNVGNTEVRPIVVFTGPLTNPFIANGTISGEPKIELVNPEVREAREKVEAEKRAEWQKEKEKSEISTKELEEKVAALKLALEKTEKEEAEKSEKPTIATGDQVLVKLGIPHLTQYYVGGIPGTYTNIARWVTYASEWWDLLPGNNSIKFGSIDTTNTGGTAEIEWASAYQL